MNRQTLALVVMAFVLAIPRPSVCVEVHKYMPSARSTALGSTGVADGNDPWNLVRNPAVLGALEGIYFSGSSTGAFINGSGDCGWLAGVGYGLDSGKHLLRVSAAVHGVSISRAGSDCGDEKYTGLTGAVEFNAENGLFIGVGITGRALKNIRYVDYSSWTIYDSWTVTCRDAPDIHWDYGTRIGYLHRREDGTKVVAAFGAAINNRIDTYLNVQSGDARLESRFGIHLMYETEGVYQVIEGLGFEAPLATVLTDIEENFVEGIDRSHLRFGIELAILKVLFLRTGVATYDSYSEGTFGAGVGISSSRMDLRFDIYDTPGESVSSTGSILSMFLRFRF